MIIKKADYLFPKLTVKVNNIPDIKKSLFLIQFLYLFNNFKKKCKFFQNQFFSQKSNNKLTFFYTKIYLHTICVNIINLNLEYEK